MGAILLNRNKPFRIPLLFIGSFWIAGWLVVGGFAFGNTLYQHYKCVNWAKSGDYSVVAGNITKFVSLTREGHQSENFWVNGVHFEYSNDDFWKCGFNTTRSQGSPINAKLPVRVSYKDGRILILEIKK